MTLIATPLYAGLAALLFLVLSSHVILTRVRQRISVGTGDNRALIKAMRLQANFVEYTPLGLLLLGLVELQGAPLWAVHLLGVCLLLGRGLHAIGFGRSPQVVSLRQAGVGLSYLMILLAALGLIGHTLF